MLEETSGFENSKAKSDVALQNFIHADSGENSLIGHNNATFTSHIPEERTEDYQTSDVQSLPRAYETQGNPTQPTRHLDPGMQISRLQSPESGNSVVIPASSDGYYSQTQKTSGPIIGMNANSEILLEAANQQNEDKNLVQQPFTSQGLINSENNMLQDNQNLPQKASSYTSYTVPNNMTNEDGEEGSKSGIAEQHNLMSTPQIQSAQNQDHTDLNAEEGTNGDYIVKAGIIGEKPQTTHQQRQKPNFISSNNLISMNDSMNGSGATLQTQKQNKVVAADLNIDEEPNSAIKVAQSEPQS